MGCIYRATCKITGKSYIGQTVNSLAHRRKWHEDAARIGGTFYFYRALRKHGFDAFDWSIIFDDIPDDELNQREIEAIAGFGTLTPRGYNSTPGGDGTRGLKWSKESRERFSKLKTGRPLSERHIAAIRAAKKGRKQSPEHKAAKLAAMNRPEVREKMRKSHTGPRLYRRNLKTAQSQMELF